MEGGSEVLVAVKPLCLFLSLCHTRKDIYQNKISIIILWGAGFYRFCWGIFVSDSDDWMFGGYRRFWTSPILQQSESDESTQEAQPLPIYPGGKVPYTTSENKRDPWWTWSTQKRRPCHLVHSLFLTSCRVPQHKWLTWSLGDRSDRLTMHLIMIRFFRSLLFYVIKLVS